MSNALLNRSFAHVRPDPIGHRGYIAAAVAGDAFSWFVALVVAVLLRYELELAEIDVSGLLWTAAAAAVGQMLVGWLGRSYTSGSAASAADPGGLTLSVFLVGLTTFVLVTLQDPPPVPRSTPLLAIPIAALLLVGVRAVLRARIERPDPTDPRRTRRAVMVGTGEDADHLVRSMLRDPSWGILPVATVGSDGARRRIAGLGTARSGERPAALAERFGADLLVIATSDGAAAGTVSAEAAAAGIPTLVVPPLAELVRSLAPADLPGPTPAAPSRGGTRGRAGTAGKRALDVVLCLAGLPVVLPVLLTVGLVLLLSGEEVLYRAPRVGLHGRRFTMFKFATMRPGDSGPRVTREGDPRITPIGRVLRSTKLNELPQIVNVLRGDMSVVGPRPEDPRYARAYTPEQRAVWSVRPGMTSVAYLDFGDEQVYIERARPDDVESFYLGELLPAKLEIELGYVRSWTVGGDMVIIARTLGRLLARR